MGPLQGFRIVELAGIGPGPFAAMLLADLGAEVVEVRRPGDAGPFPLPRHLDCVARGRRTLTLDVKQAVGLDALLRLIDRADGLIEGFRPGVMERLGAGPDICLARNPRLVYGRMTGFGQSGPLAQAAGHDLNYLSLTGALHAMGRADAPPAPPLNLVADYGGGAMFLAFGMLAALLERQSSGKGQVVDAAMTDGAALLTAMFQSLRAGGLWSEARGANYLDGGAPFYDCYGTRDGKFVAVAALEPKFFAELVRLTGLDPGMVARQYDKRAWPDMRGQLAGTFAARTRDEWVAALEGQDACVTGILTFAEAAAHPHNGARATYVEAGGVAQPAPAPRFSRTPAAAPAAPALPQAGAILAEAGFEPDEIAALQASGAAV